MMRLLSARWVIPIRPARTVLPYASVVVEGDRIIDLLPSAEARQKYPQAVEERFDQHALLPGFVNLHAHTAMTLFRGLADDRALMDWLQNHIWPAEGRWLSGQFVHDGTLLGAAEMLKSGITTVNDMYFYPADAARAYLAAGLRAMIGLTVLEFPTPYAADAPQYLQHGLAARDEFLAEPLLGFALAPHAPYTVTDDTFRQVLTLAEELDIPIHTHLHETAFEVSDAAARTGQRPLARLDELGLISPRLIAAHGVHLTPAEIQRLAQCNACIAHNPSSNLKLASGIAPVADLLAAGVTVGLGSDGAASNNRQDIFTEMRLVALLAKAQSQEADALPAWQALEMATVHGARALGWDSQTGSLENGKQADLIAVEMDDLYTAPVFDPVSHLVYVCGREHVSDVWVAGRRRVAHRRLHELDEARLKALAASWRQKIASAQ